MKWFQLDSDMPTDPKIRELLRRQGNAGLGALVRLWCYVAAHGTKRPGWALDSRGRPISKQILADMAGLSVDEFEILQGLLLELGHINATEWKRRATLVFPAMFNRTDTYSRRKFEHVRTVFEHSSNNVRVQDSTVQDSTTSTKEQERRYSGAVAPRKNGRPKTGKDPYPVVLKIASDLLGRIPIRKPVELASLKEDVKRRCARLSIPYEGDVVGRAVESALAVRAKVAKV